jgi:shikimate kinase
MWPRWPGGWPISTHIILVGLPGAGKTTVGMAVAEVLGRPFVDLDAEIVRAAGRPITAIFATQGEPRFRALEREATARLADGPASVLAPGGGWVTEPATVALLRPPARMTYLKVSPRTAAYRLRRSVHTRPLLRDDPMGSLTRLLAARAAAYETADLVLDTEALTRQQVIDRVVSLVSADVTLGKG